MGTENTKLCPRCNQVKPYSEYGTRSRGGIESYCKPCYKEYRKKQNKKYYRENKEKLNRENRERAKVKKYKYPEYQSKWRKENRTKLSTKSWERGLERRYGITTQDYSRMLEEQSGACAICGTHTPWERSKRFAVDHCHETGKVRGLLCHHCNKALGLFQDSPSTLRKAALYLEGK